jgi:hypothetical protein
MGQLAECSAKFKRRTSRGKALLETDKLIFRGDFNLSIDLKEVKKIEAKNGELQLTHPLGEAVFCLGRLADKWSEKIRHPTTLMQKLGVNSGSKVILLGVKDSRFVKQLKKLTSNISYRKTKQADLIFLAAESKRALDNMRTLRKHIKPTGAIWVVAPKGKDLIKEGDILEAGKAAGLVDIKVARFSKTHTAHKFVIPVADR